jgi:hypothetical protein
LLHDVLDSLSIAPLQARHQGCIVHAV